MIVKFLESDIPVQSYVHLKFTLWQIRNWESGFKVKGFKVFLGQMK